MPILVFNFVFPTSVRPFPNPIGSKKNLHSGGYGGCANDIIQMNLDMESREMLTPVFFFSQNEEFPLSENLFDQLLILIKIRKKYVIKLWKELG